MFKATKMAMIVLTAVTVLMLGSAMTSAQDKFPAQPIDLVIGFGVGGGADTMTRIMQPALEKALGVNTPVSNISGASGDVGLGKLLSRKPDGYAVGFQNSNSICNMALGTSPFKMDDFIYLCRAHMSTFWLFVNSEDTRFKTWEDVVKFAKENPNKLTVSAEGLGGQDELVVRFLADNGIKTKIVPYGNPQQRYTAVVGKHEDLLVEQVGDVINFVENKQLRPIIVFDKNRDKNFPDVVCSYEKGLQYDSAQFRGYCLKKGVPAARVKVLADGFEKAYNSPDYQKALKTWSVDSQATWMGPDKFTAYIKSFHTEIATLAKKYGMVAAKP